MVWFLRNAVGMSAVICLSFLGGCTQSEASPDAQPCGGCGEGEVCTESGACVLSQDDCSKTCSEVGKACGTHCGASCGSCPAGTACAADGQCSCEPSCVGQTCGEGDGCGSACGPCPTDVSCDDCVLRLSVVERERIGGVLTGVTIAIDYHPSSGTPLPGIADFRLKIQGPATVARVGLAQRLTDLGKELSVDGTTGRAWRTTAAGDTQLLLLSPSTSAPITAGRVAVVRLTLGTVDNPAQMPVAVSLIEREQIFAPKVADEALWSGGFAKPVSIWPEVSDAE
jgi:hypothetical protein